MSLEVPTSNDLRTTKRKLDDAIYSLDKASGSSETISAQPPAKKAHTVKSLYSTLAKYNINIRDSRSTSVSAQSISNSTPHLSAIVSRTASRAKKSMPFKPPADVPVAPRVEYRPSSIPSFLTRLATFKLATYANKPSQIDAVAASKCGWMNDGKDRLVCGICQVSWVVSHREGLGREASNALYEKQRVNLVESHKAGCPWKTKQCDDEIYRIPLKSSAAMTRNMKMNAVILDTVMAKVEVQHPLSASQTQSLCKTISSVQRPVTDLDASESIPTTPTQRGLQQAPHSSPPCNSAVVASLFGWTIAPPPAPRISSPSISRARTLSRATSASPSPSSTPRRLPHKTIGIPSSASALGSITSRHTPSRLGSSTRREAGSVSPSGLTRSISTRGPSTLGSTRGASTYGSEGADTTLLHCVLCQRRVGMWAFSLSSSPDSTPPIPTPQFIIPTPSESLPPAASISAAFASTASLSTRTPMIPRPFDLLKEHRSFCPYVVKSTILPTIPTSSSSGSRVPVPAETLETTMPAIEGWKALLTVILRYGAGQRSRMGSLSPNQIEGQDEGGDEMLVDGVQAMMATVKARGGRELLKYVKGLLG